MRKRIIPIAVLVYIVGVLTGCHAGDKSNLLKVEMQPDYISSIYEARTRDAKSFTVFDAAEDFDFGVFTRFTESDFGMTDYMLYVEWRAINKSAYVFEDLTVTIGLGKEMEDLFYAWPSQVEGDLDVCYPEGMVDKSRYPGTEYCFTGPGASMASRFFLRKSILRDSVAERLERSCEITITLSWTGGGAEYTFDVPAEIDIE